MTDNNKNESGLTKALLRSLNFSGVQFIRYLTVDPYNTIRAKAVPVQHLLKKDVDSLDHQVSVAEVCYGGLPSYADVMLDGTGMSPRNVCSIVADPGTLRILPYAKKTAVVMSKFQNQYTDEPSPFCGRSRLIKVIQEAAETHNVAFNVGAELEFCLVDAKTGKFVDNSIFANTTTLNNQQEFISTLYEQCQQQYFSIEVIHAESAGGQIEVVLEYCKDPLEMCDNIILVKETIQAVAYTFGLKALFLPKFDMMKAGNGLHVHLSIRDATTGSPIFCDGSSLSAQGSAFVEGILQHLPGITGLSLPTVNSHRRVGKGCWTGSLVGWALEDKEVGIRVCSNLRTKEWDHVECKLLDPTANPYLAVGAMLYSGLSGIAEQATLRPSLHEIEANDEAASPLPNTLGKALDALEADSALTKSFLGEALAKAYLTVRRHEMKRSSIMTVEDEVLEAIS